MRYELYHTPERDEIHKVRGPGAQYLLFTTLQPNDNVCTNGEEDSDLEGLKRPCSANEHRSRDVTEQTQKACSNALQHRSKGGFSRVRLYGIGNEGHDGQCDYCTARSRSTCKASAIWISRQSAS